MEKTKHDSLPVAIAKVLNDWKIDDKTKLKRIEVYIQIYFENKEQSLEDMV